MNAEVRPNAYRHHVFLHLVAQTDAAGHTVTRVYDGYSRVTTQTDPRGNSTSFVYDKRGNPTRQTFCDASFEVLGYNREGQLTAKTDRGGRRISRGNAA